MSSSSSSRIGTLSDAEAYLDGLINRERAPGYAYARLDLRPIRALLDRLGQPDEVLSVVHVAGSKGKGSTCLLAESILLELGESVGTFTSPHLESWVERFRVDGRPVEWPRLVHAVDRIRPHVEALRAGPPAVWPSFFDATTAVAFLIFAESGVDHALIEVGLGGRLDSTNVVWPRVTCITSIELEHVDKLGPTEAAIAGEKAGILKPGIVAVLGPLRLEAEAVIRARAETVGAPTRAWGEAFEVLESPLEGGREGSVFRYVERRPGAQRAEHRSGREAARPTERRADDAAEGPGAREIEPETEAGDFEVEVELAMSGAPARTNAALAIACVRALDAHPDETLAPAIRRALARARLPGRIERLESDPAVLIDSAHTARSARALADALATLAPTGFDLLLSVSSDKDLGSLLEPLLPAARRVWTTCADPVRSLPAEGLAESVRSAGRPDLEVVAVGDPAEAIPRARAALPDGGVLCVTGSIYLAGLARRLLGGGDPRPPARSGSSRGSSR